MQDQVAIVTGGTRGIGRAIAEALARAGANVVITGRALESTEAAAAEIAATTGGRVTGIAADVSDSAACQQLVEGVIASHGRLDVLVNNAGITRDKLIARMSDEDWAVILQTNLNSVFYLSRAAARVMAKARVGRIINISSVVGVMGNAGQTNYAASKAGIIGFTKALARELGGRGVTVNCVAPGFIETAMTDVLSEEIKVKLKDQIPLGRLGRPEDVAAAVEFLAGPGAAYITGAVLLVDGGMAM